MTKDGRTVEVGVVGNEGYVGGVQVKTDAVLGTACVLSSFESNKYCAVSVIGRLRQL